MSDQRSPRSSLARNPVNAVIMRRARCLLSVAAWSSRLIGRVSLMFAANLQRKNNFFADVRGGAYRVTFSYGHCSRIVHLAKHVRD
jgi:hypothetical protein